ncbi:MAG: hypothetical protein JO242_17240, partial [Streptosporangiaceae bacterium]|nr:hypothetical protein [Streptosporangiaceae bacterium]
LIVHWNGRAWSQVASSNPGSKADVLNGVQGIAASNVWAVGLYENGLFGLSLALHWNGHGWTKVATPNPTGSSELLGVDATSAANAWAVGDDGKGESVTLRWNGRTWTRVPSPDILRGDDNILHSVAATSPTNAWAVGAANNLSTGTAFELHWNGRKWTNMASPNPGANSSMDAVAATSASNAWAVGEYGLNPPATTQRALAFHCT